MLDLIQQFLPLFIETAHTRLARAQALAISNDSAALADELHAFAGEAGVLGLFALASTVRDAEVFARSVKPNDTSDECEQMVENIRALVAELENKPASNEPASNEPASNESASNEV